MQTLFEKFTIISVLKKTEFSSVYLANHIFLEKRIILKTLDSAKIIDKNDLLRFKREAKILAKLNHPNIIRVLDFGTFENFVYISFEYFKAQTLREIMNSGKLSAIQKTDLLKQIATGLNYAHTNNFIHRDVKPENILVDENNHLKIADFGLALSDESRVLTDPQSMMGTPAYASPEQVSGAALTPASDLFSLGLIAFELFNKYNPILGKDIGQTINNIINFDEEKHDTLVYKTAENVKSIIIFLLNPDPLHRKIPENLLENDTFAAAERLPLVVRMLWLVPVVTILLVFIFYLFYDASIDTTSLGKQDPLSMDMAIAESSEVIDAPKEKSASDAQLSDPQHDTTIVPEIFNQKAQLQIAATPAATLYINSKKHGKTTPKVQIELQAGMYQVTLKNENFPDYQQDIELKAGEHKMLAIDLRKFSGILKVFTHPWAVVEINGKNYGQTPLEKPIQLKNGTYTLELKNPGFDTYKKVFKIGGADTVLIQHNFANPGLGTKIE